MTSHDISKGLEVWTLQTLLNISIILGLLALGLALVRKYFDALENHLTLRVSIEIWKVLTTVVVDFLLVVIALVGLMVLNPDIMADIKIAIPFVPLAVTLFTIALILRLFHGGLDSVNPNFMRAAWLMFWANLINLAGFAFVMEAPAGEYLAKHPNAVWTLLKSQLRSNANLEFSQVTFWIFFPLLLLVYLWGFRSALARIKQKSPDGIWRSNGS